MVRYKLKFSFSHDEKKNVILKSNLNVAVVDFFFSLLFDKNHLKSEPRGENK